MQARGGFIENVDLARLLELGRELDALPLAAGQRAQRLAQRHVAETHLDEAFERLAQWRLVEELARLGGAQIEHLVNVLAAKSMVQHLLA